MKYLIVVFALVSFPGSDSRGIGKCDQTEYNEVEKSHIQCTQQVEERYALILDSFQVVLPSPVASANHNTTHPIKQTQDISQLCNMLHDVVEKCGILYQKCLDDKDYREYLDGQLEIFIQMMSTLYNLGDEIRQCEAVKEYESSGRSEEVHPTDACTVDKVKSLTIRYQQCMEDANLEMTRKMIGHQHNFELSFDALCTGIHEVVHGCSDMLKECYTYADIEETKIGQLELMRKVFMDIIADSSSNENSETWNFDITKCKAFNSGTRIFYSSIYLILLPVAFCTKLF